MVMFIRQKAAREKEHHVVVIHEGAVRGCQKTEENIMVTVVIHQKVCEDAASKACRVAENVRHVEHAENKQHAAHA